MTKTSDYIEDRLREWGATRIESRPVPGDEERYSIDFQTPFPGDQPIRSSLSVIGDAVNEATIRYGVLDESAFPTHPTDDPDQLDRLHLVATRSGVFDVGVVVVNFGDTHRLPRPHLLLGWKASVSKDDEVVVANDYDRDYPVDATLDIIERFGENVRREFRGEWVQENEDEDEGEMPDLRDLAPDHVTEGWDDGR